MTHEGFNFGEGTTGANEIALWLFWHMEFPAYGKGTASARVNTDFWHTEFSANGEATMDGAKMNANDF